MTTLAHPALTHRGRTQTFLTATLAALALLILLVWALSTIVDAAHFTSGSTTRPNPQAQTAPPKPGPPISSDDHARDAHAPNPQAQIPPQPARQTADTEL